MNDHKGLHISLELPLIKTNFQKVSTSKALQTSVVHIRDRGKTLDSKNAY